MEKLIEKEEKFIHVGELISSTLGFMGEYLLTLKMSFILWRNWNWKIFGMEINIREMGNISIDIKVNILICKENMIVAKSLEHTR